MHEEKYSVEEIFGSLISRLHGINSGSIDYQRLFPFIEEMAIIKEKVYSLNHQKACAAVGYTNQLVANVMNQLNDTLMKVEFVSDSFSFLSNGNLIRTAKQKRVAVSKSIVEELGYYSTELSKIENNLMELMADIDSSDLLSGDHKIKVNITIVQLAALFRIMFEAGLLNHQNKSELASNISKCFSTKSGGGKSSKGIYNAMFTDVAKDGFSFWASKLPEMQGLIKKKKLG